MEVNLMFKMFYCFYTFEEVVKLSRSTFNHLRRINYSDRVLEIIYVRLDINTAEQIFNLIEDVSMINKFVNILSIIRTVRILKDGCNSSTIPSF